MERTFNKCTILDCDNIESICIPNNGCWLYILSCVVVQRGCVRGWEWPGGAGVFHPPCMYALAMEVKMQLYIFTTSHNTELRVFVPQILAAFSVVLNYPIYI